MKNQPAIVARALQNCATEPVRTPGTIQNGGALIAAHRRTKNITYASENAFEYFDDCTSNNALFTAKLTEILSGTAMHGLNNALTTAVEQHRRTYATAIDTPRGPATVHTFQAGDHIILELEPNNPADVLSAQNLQGVLQLLNRIDADDSEIGLLQDAAQLLRALTGYDRVIAYRFDHDFNGECIAEACSQDMESYLGLRFPAWDIPPQARAIMGDIPVRFIIDSAAAPIPLQARSLQLPALDITLANLRGVSPVHMEYLRNMGVAATLTLSLKVQGQLWGMISCHNRLSKAPTSQMRLICEAVLPLLQTKLELAIRNRTLRMTRQLDALRHETQNELDRAPSLPEAFAKVAPRILERLGGCGMFLKLLDVEVSKGDLPGAHVLGELQRRAQASENGTYGTDHLGEDIDFADHHPGIAGALAMSLGRDTTCVVFRRPVAATVAWAGKPDKDVTVQDGTPTLHPRASFARYLEQVDGKSTPWSVTDVQNANALFASFVAAHNAAAPADAERNRYMLILREMEHRYKNVFSVILSIARQSRKTTADPDDFVSGLEQRLSAMAAAHELALAENIEARTLSEIARHALRPFASDPQAFLHLPQIEPKLRRKAFQLLALVVHELATNSAKYGALGPQQGRLSVRSRMVEDGLQIIWAEKCKVDMERAGNPGFGTKLINSTIQYELSGRSELDYQPTGITARFWIPAEWLSGGQSATPSDAQVKPETVSADPPKQAIPGKILILEDSFAISHHLKEIFVDLGAHEIEQVSNVHDAEQLLQNWAPDLACIDIQLGQQPDAGLRVADQLRAAGAQLIFVTGYGSDFQLPARFSDAPRLAKPVSDVNVGSALRALTKATS